MTIRIYRTACGPAAVALVHIHSMQSARSVSRLFFHGRPVHIYSILYPKLRSVSVCACDSDECTCECGVCSVHMWRHTQHAASRSSDVATLAMRAPLHNRIPRVFNVRYDRGFVVAGSLSNLHACASFCTHTHTSVRLFRVCVCVRVRVQRSGPTSTYTESARPHDTHCWVRVCVCVWVYRYQKDTHA